MPEPKSNGQQISANSIGSKSKIKDRILKTLPIAVPGPYLKISDDVISLIPHSHETVKGRYAMKIWIPQGNSFQG